MDLLLSQTLTDFQQKDCGEKKNLPLAKLPSITNTITLPITILQRKINLVCVGFTYTINIVIFSKITLQSKINLVCVRFSSSTNTFILSKTTLQARINLVHARFPYSTNNDIVNNNIAF